MRSALIAGAATLLLSAGSAFAAGASSTATGVPPAVAPETSGYVYPDSHSLSGDWRGTTVPPAPTTGHFNRSRIYLYPPSDGSDDSTG